MHNKPGIENIPPSQTLQHINGLIQQANDAEASEKNDFPLSVLPPPMQEIITAAHQNLNYPVDFTASAMLFAASVAIGNTYNIEVKSEFQQSAVLYLAIVARAGTNKSHPLSFAMRPIIDNDKRAYARYEQQKKQYDKLMALDRKERDKQSDNEPEKPVYHKMLVSDFTPEALVEVHRCNKRGIGVCIDELAGWFKNFNRYNQGSEMEFWLSNWNSKRIDIDRKTGEPLSIPTPFISVAGTIQTAMLNEMAGHSRTKNGFMDRILFVMPDNLQKPYWSDTEIAPYLVKNWNIIITSLLEMPVRLDDTLNPEPQILYLSQEAKSILFDWQKLNADQCNNAENEAIAGIYSKFEMYAARLALILELLNFACEIDDLSQISATSVQGALQLVEYFKKNAVKVHQAICNNNHPLLRYPLPKQNLYNQLPTTFTTEDGLHLALKLGIGERAFFRLLRDRELFKHINHGEYEKCF
jgi:hypothetical protein